MQLSSILLLSASIVAAVPNPTTSSTCLSGSASSSAPSKDSKTSETATKETSSSRLPTHPPAPSSFTNSTIHPSTPSGGYGTGTAPTGHPSSGSVPPAGYSSTGQPSGGHPSVTPPPATITQGACPRSTITLTLPPTTLTLPPSTVTITLPPSTLTLPPSTVTNTVTVTPTGCDKPNPPSSKPVYRLYGQEVQAPYAKSYLAQVFDASRNNSYQALIGSVDWPVANATRYTFDEAARRLVTETQKDSNGLNYYNVAPLEGQILKFQTSISDSSTDGQLALTTTRGGLWVTSTKAPGNTSPWALCPVRGRIPAPELKELFYAPNALPQSDCVKVILQTERV